MIELCNPDSNLLFRVWWFLASLMTPDDACGGRKIGVDRVGACGPKSSGQARFPAPDPFDQSSE